VISSAASHVRVRLGALAPGDSPLIETIASAVESSGANQHHRLDRLETLRRLVSPFARARSYRSSTSLEVLFPSAHAAALRYPGRPRLRTIPLRRSPFHDPRLADAFVNELAPAVFRRAEVMRCRSMCRTTREALAHREASNGSGRAIALMRCCARYARARRSPCFPPRPRCGSSADQ